MSGQQSNEQSYCKIFHLKLNFTTAEILHNPDTYSPSNLYLHKENEPSISTALKINNYLNIATVRNSIKNSRTILPSMLWKIDFTTRLNHIRTRACFAALININVLASYKSSFGFKIPISNGA